MRTATATLDRSTNSRHQTCAAPVELEPLAEHFGTIGVPLVVSALADVERALVTDPDPNGLAGRHLAELRALRRAANEVGHVRHAVETLPRTGHVVSRPSTGVLADFPDLVAVPEGHVRVTVDATVDVWAHLAAVTGDRDLAEAVAGDGDFVLAVARTLAASGRGPVNRPAVKNALFKALFTATPAASGSPVATVRDMFAVTARFVASRYAEGGDLADVHRPANAETSARLAVVAGEAARLGLTPLCWVRHGLVVWSGPGRTAEELVEFASTAGARARIRPDRR